MRLLRAWRAGFHFGHVLCLFSWKAKARKQSEEFFQSCGLEGSVFTYFRSATCKATAILEYIEYDLRNNLNTFLVYYTLYRLQEGGIYWVAARRPTPSLHVNPPTLPCINAKLFTLRYFKHRQIETVRTQRRAYSKQQSYGSLAWAVHMKSLSTLYVPSQNEGPYFQPRLKQGNRR